jgi:XTP/dITP diphosphohydrolase
MRKLLIATRSKGKLPEIINALKELPFEFVGLNDIPDLPSNYTAEEPGLTFEGNAIIKAIFYGKKTGLLTLSEDAGLMVDALDGKPGIYTARYAEGTDEDRYNKLLKELKDVPIEKRNAKFIAVTAIYDPQNDKIRTCEGTYEGRIALEPIGSDGFGYDPVFYNDQLKKTNAQMTIEEKNDVSHRGKSLKKAIEILKMDFI